MPSDIQVAVSNEGDVRVVAVQGTVDLESSPKLQKDIQQALNGALSLAIDLSGVGYIDSSGIATLVQALKLAKKSNVEMRLRNPATRVLAVLKMAHLTKLFTIDQPEAG